MRGDEIDKDEYVQPPSEIVSLLIVNQYNGNALDLFSVSFRTLPRSKFYVADLTCLNLDLSCGPFVLTGRQALGGQLLYGVFSG
ncbi:hypothetical protein GQ457_18G020540 [Hibiscus cannabinus]